MGPDTHGRLAVGANVRCAAQSAVLDLVLDFLRSRASRVMAVLGAADPVRRQTRARTPAHDHGTQPVRGTAGHGRSAMGAAPPEGGRRSTTMMVSNNDDGIRLRV
jgi:hypothetical protein